jgi:hypothetical protein
MTPTEKLDKINAWQDVELKGSSKLLPEILKYMIVVDGKIHFGQRAHTIFWITKIKNDVLFK